MVLSQKNRKIAASFQIQKHRAYCLTILLLFIISSGIPAVAAAEEPPIRKVLVLHSYHKGHVWSDEVNEGITSVLEDQGHNVELYIEYMDTARISERGYTQKMYELYRVKFSDIRFDAVIVSDDNAYQFLIKRHRDLFPNTPIVFCGVNHFEESQLENWDLCTGVVEAYDLRETIDIALALHPSTRQVVVINDGSVTGNSNREVLNEIIPEYGKEVEFVFFKEKTMEELQEAVSALPDDSIVLLLTFNRDITGNYYEYDESIALIAESSSVPIYGVWEFYLGKGLMGGKLTSGYHQGRTAAEITLRVLDGEDIRTIPIVTEIDNRYMFDYVQLQRFGISTGSLPEGSKVINQLIGFIPVDIRVFWGAIAGIAGLMGTILILAVNISRRKVAEGALRESEERFRNLSQLQHEALQQIEENLEQMAILNDHIRNPLTVIVAHADMQGGEIRDAIMAQAKEIDLIINKLDRGWLESEKVREFLKRHYPR